MLVMFVFTLSNFLADKFLKKLVCRDRQHKIAIATLVWIRIPQPEERRGAREKRSAGEKRIGNTEDIPQVSKSPSPPVTKEEAVNQLAILWAELTFGIRYIWRNNGLRTLLIVTALFWFAHDLGSAIATLTAGLLSDRLLEPAMQSDTVLSSLFAPIFGNGAGAGMALLYVSCAIAMFSVGAIGFRLPQLNQLEDR